MSSFYTLSVQENTELYSENAELMSVILFLSELKIPDGCPIKTHIALDAIKQWAIVCKDNKIICTKSTLVEQLTQSYRKLYETITNEVQDYDLKMKYWNESGINFYREKLKEDELRQTRNQM